MKNWHFATLVKTVAAIKSCNISLIARSNLLLDRIAWLRTAPLRFLSIVAATLAPTQGHRAEAERAVVLHRGNRSAAKSDRRRADQATWS